MERFYQSHTCEIYCTISPEDIISPVIQDDAPSLTQLILKAANGSLSLSDYVRHGGEYDNDEDFDNDDDFDPRSADIVELQERRDMLYSQLRRASEVDPGKEEPPEVDPGKEEPPKEESPKVD